MENSKQNIPLKAIGLRLSVFLKQNKMSAKKLIEKLVITKNQSKHNQQKNKVGSTISINFFAKFVKAKVDKKRNLEEIKYLAK
jgi:DNA-binding Xre family transcriptional regulator